MTLIEKVLLPGPRSAIAGKIGWPVCFTLKSFCGVSSEFDALSDAKGFSMVDELFTRTLA